MWGSGGCCGECEVAEAVVVSWVGGDEVDVQTAATNIVGIRRQVYRFNFSQQLPDIFHPIFYDTFYKAWLHFESAWLGLIYIGICGSIVVILLQGCIFDACGSYHTIFAK